MHPVNRVLSIVGLQLSRTQKVPREFIAEYKRTLVELQNNPPRGFAVLKNVAAYEVGTHPENYIDYECQFASFHIQRLNPQTILDIGSYRHFIIGLLSHYKVTTMDVRSRVAFLDNETVITGDAKNLGLPNDSFDTITSLSALEHFGLGRYGDEVDMYADIKAFREMIRVLKPGGCLIFTTTITRARPSIVWNQYRTYSYEMIKELCSGLSCVNERLCSCAGVDLGQPSNLTEDPNMVWDVYCGCWKK